jgi:hypothetical protein
MNECSICLSVEAKMISLVTQLTFLFDLIVLSLHIEICMILCGLSRHTDLLKRVACSLVVERACKEVCA